jgi:hypothetical protein
MEEEVMQESPMMESRPMMSEGPKEWRPNKSELLREYEIKVRFLSVGCVVSVGCKEIPFRSVKEAMEEVNNYINNPWEEGKKWRKLFESED